MQKDLFAVDRIHLNKSQGAIKALVAIRIANAFVVRNLKVVEGKNGLFVAMPSEKYVDKSSREPKYADLAFPVNKEAHQYLQAMVLAAYAQKQNAEAGGVGRKE